MQYAQWHVFMEGGIKTGKQAAEFTAASGKLALSQVLSDVPLKRYVQVATASVFVIQFYKSNDTRVQRECSRQAVAAHVSVCPTSW